MIAIEKQSFHSFGAFSIYHFGGHNNQDTDYCTVYRSLTLLDKPLGEDARQRAQKLIGPGFLY